METPTSHPPILLLLLLTCSATSSFAQTEIRADWRLSYDAGYVAEDGAYAGGSEIMHLVRHKGKLYAAIAWSSFLISSSDRAPF